MVWIDNWSEERLFSIKTTLNHGSKQVIQRFSWRKEARSLAVQDFGFCQKMFNNGSNLCPVEEKVEFFEDHRVFQPTLRCLYRAVTPHIGLVCKSRRRYGKSSVNYYRNSVATFILEYLLLCGDINPNPGPDSCLFDALHTVSDNGKQGI